MTFTGRGLFAASSKEPGRRHLGWLLIGAFVAVAALVVGGLSAVGGISTSQTAQEESFGDADEVVVDNRTSGDVRVTGTSGDAVTVERTVRDTLMSSAHEQVGMDGASTVNVDAGCDGIAFFGGCQVDYRIGVPEGTAVQADAHSGEVRVNAVTGEVAVSTSSGEVRANRVEGDLTVDTTSGGMRLEEIDGDMDLEATSGSIWASGSGGSIQVDATSGSIQLMPDDATDVEASASSGSINVHGSFATLDTNASSGSVDIDAAEPFQRITAEASSGSLAMRVPDTEYAVTADSSSGSRDIDVTKNDNAEAEIDAKTSSGSIEITPRG
ncbi:hypothetical protein F4561_000311 [Lipingzhangella halophila]|uniref:DUF4097 domain-containing protein n=1 Tax=Lipingzhangella halophila TaxID=1783352 RepID=A0A7W7W0D0_9ACTN|nr:DUF4097 family beta strand repeat-containing protein [Lipingzhangella halophila]MBB4929491.1 hypothetical protein [Lipingzhangella halophila]